MIILHKEITLKIIVALLLCLFGGTNILFNDVQSKELISAQCEPLVENRSPVKELRHAQGMLWEISKAGNENSYLFGTIHVSDAEITTLPDIVDKALHDSEQFVMEVLPDFEQMRLFSRTMFFSDGQLLSNFVDAPIYEETKRILSAYNLGADAVSVMKPWAAFLLMNYPPDEGEALDLVLLTLAKQNGNSVTGLESLKEQGDIFTQLNMQEQVTLLTDTVCHYAVVEEDFLAIKEFYLKRDMAGLYNYTQRYTMNDKPVYKKLMKKLIVDRNYKMVSRMQSVLEKGHSFIAIGAMHLTGKEGVLALLEKQDYNVLAIY